MSIGLLGGTFDPIHVGHLRAAENAREGFGLERVIFVPAARPPHRPEPRTPALDRYAMTCLAVAGHPSFEVSDLELRRDGPSYTVDTLAALAGTSNGQELVLVVGGDTFPEVRTWREAARIFELAVLGVVERPGGTTPSDAEAAPGARVRRAFGPGLDVSATQVRERVAGGLSVRYLVPDGVADYIAKRRLYR
jgi:nicotinate-nucleotide adenylyltransferase